MPILITVIRARGDDFFRDLKETFAPSRFLMKRSAMMEIADVQDKPPVPGFIEDVYFRTCVDQADSLADGSEKDDKLMEVVKELAFLGRFDEAFDWIDRMQNQDKKSHAIHFLSYACSNLGILDKALEFAHRLTNPQMKEFSFFAILGELERTGQADEAFEVLKMIPRSETNSGLIDRCLVGIAGKFLNNRDVAKAIEAFDLIELEEHKSSLRARLMKAAS